MPEDDTVDGDGDDTDEQTSGDDAGLLARLEAMDTERWAEAIVTGAVAYGVGYLVMAGLFFLGPVSTSGLTLREKLGAIGVTFNAAHHIQVMASKPVLVLAESEATLLGETFSLFELSDVLGAEQALPRALYLAIPVVLLVTIGFSRAWRLSPMEDVWGPVKTSLGIPVGYAAVAYLGSLLFSYPLGTGKYPVIANISILSDSAGYTFVEQGNTTRILGQSGAVAEIQGNLQNESAVMISSDGAGALLLGLAYPLVFATLGALAAVSLRQYRTGDSPDDTEKADG